MIPSGCTMTLEEFDAKRDDFMKGGYTVVTYCTAGLRSFRYADSLIHQHGFHASKVYNLVGSIVAWTQEGLPLVQRKQLPEGGLQLVETNHVHVYSKDWALQGHGYRPVFLQAAPWSLSSYISSLVNIWNKIASSLLGWVLVKRKPQVGSK